MRTFKQAQFDIALRAKAQFELADSQVTLPGAMTPLSHTSHTSTVPSIFSGLEREQNAVNEAIDHAFQVKDYGTLYDTLDFLKFRRIDAEAIVGVAATAAGFLSGVGSILAAVQTVSELLKFFGTTSSGGFDLENTVKSIGEEVHRIYLHLIDTALEEQVKLAEEFHNSIESVRNTVKSVQVTGLSPATIVDLGHKLDELDDTIGKLLTISNGDIPFSPNSYKNSWYDYSGTPYLAFADGRPTKKLEPLVSKVWDPGHYTASLATAIRLRVAAGVTLEPLFRSTGHRRPSLESMVPKRRTFIDHWRDSFWVAQPINCMLADGTLPLFGILIGTVCPVTGISSLQNFSNFPMVTTGTPERGWPWASGYIYQAKAIDPQSALHDALVQHQIAVNRVQQSCGLREFEQLYKGLKDVAGPPRPTESVHFEAVYRLLPTPILNAQFEPMPQQTTVDLGDLKRWAVDPNKTYSATRFFTTGGKIVTMRLGRRARTSQVRIGYRIRISGELFDITTWESAPPGELANQIDWFPTESFEKVLTLQAKVYDCVQSRVLTAAEEESYDENGDDGNAQRLLVNERQATVNVKVQVDFTALAGGDNKAHLGEVRLTFMPDDVLDQPHAYLLDIDVLETHVKSFSPSELEEVLEEVTVEGMSLHIVPSWLKVPAEFFDDYQDALERMFRAATLGRRFQRQLSLDDIPRFVDPQPKYLTVREAATVALMTRMFERAEQDASFSAEVQKFLIPQENR